MNVKEFESLKNTIEKKKIEKIKAEGNIDMIKKELKEKYGSSVEDAKEAISLLKKELAEKSQRIDTLYSKVLRIVQ